MKTLFTIVLLSLLTAIGVSAQSPYTITALTQTYTPLTGAASANGSTVWHTQFFTMPLGFTAKIGNTTVNKVYTDGAVIYADTAGSSVDIFQLYFAHTIDRGSTGAVSKSPLLYTTTGTAPNRIFKFEARGGGFFEEQQKYGTFTDSFDFQFWLYEGSNAAELRFGPSKISHDTDYFPGGRPSFTGYFNVNFTTGEGNIGYFAAGPVTAPYTDSFTATHMPGLLNAYPPAGTVYRFTPKAVPTAVGATTAPLHASVYPTLSTGMLSVHYDEAIPATYRIVSATGALLQEGTLHQGVHIIDISSLVAGSYMLQVQAADKRATCRFGKQ